MSLPLPLSTVTPTPCPVLGSPLKILLAWTAGTVKHERPREMGNVSQQKHLWKTEWLSFIHGLGWRSCLTCLLLFPEQLPNTYNYWPSLPGEKRKSSPLSSLQERRHRKGCSQHGWQQEISVVQRGPSPQIFLFKVCCGAQHHLKYSVIFSIAGGQFLSAHKTWSLSPK